MKCTKNYNARAQPLFSSLNLLFSDVAVAVTVVVILSSLLSPLQRKLARTRVLAGTALFLAKNVIRGTKLFQTSAFHNVGLYNRTSVAAQ